MSKKTTQREARELRKRVRELEGRLMNFHSYLPGPHLWSFTPSEAFKATLKVAAKLDHTVVVRMDGSEVSFFAVRQ